LDADRLSDLEEIAGWYGRCCPKFTAAVAQAPRTKAARTLHGQAFIVRFDRGQPRSDCGNARPENIDVTPNIDCRLHRNWTPGRYSSASTSSALLTPSALSFEIARGALESSTEGGDGHRKARDYSANSTLYPVYPVRGLRRGRPRQLNPRH
jgi:hypothetical protein